MLENYCESEADPDRSSPYLLRNISLFSLLCYPVACRTQPIKYCIVFVYLFICLFEPVHSKLFKDKEHVLFIFVSIAFSTGLADSRNAINLCLIEERRRLGERLRHF